MFSRIEKKAVETKNADTFFAIPLKETSRKFEYFMLLLAVCAIAFVSVTALYALRQKSLVWNFDGLYLYYTFFISEGEWLRDIASSIFSGDPVFPMYSYDIGLGADLLITASSNFNDPLNLVSAFCPPAIVEYVYAFLIFVRFYLAAASFSLYCFSRGRGKIASMMGAICYVLSGFVIFWGVTRHPNFINLAFYLPLVLMGADKIFAKKNPLLFILSLGGIFLFSLYFGYMVCVSLLLYCLITYFCYPRHRSIRDFFALVLKFAICILCAFAIVGFSSVPMLLSLTSMGRVGVERALTMFQSYDCYVSLASNLIGNFRNLGVTMLGSVPVLGILAFIAGRSHLGRETKRAWGAALILCVAGISLAYVGSVMNGFGYSTDRWQVVFCFVASYITALIIPKLPIFSRRQYLIFYALTAVIILWASYYTFKSPTRTAFIALATFVLALAIISTWVIGKRLTLRKGLQHGSKLRVFSANGLSVALTIAMIGSSALCINSYLGKGGFNYISEFMPIGTVLETRNPIEAEALDALDETGYRIDRTSFCTGFNASLSNGYKGIDFFSSFYNQNVDDFRKDLAIADNSRSHMFNGVQERLALNALLGAKFFITTEEEQNLVPPGYRKIADLGNGLMLYETANVLPLTFVYDTAIPQSVYDELSPVEKQEALTKSVVLGAVPSGTNSPELATFTEPIDLTSSDGAIVGQGQVLVTQPNSTVKFTVDSSNNVENYICFIGLQYKPMSPSKALKVAEKDDWGTAVNSIRESTSFRSAKSADISIANDLKEYSFEVATNASPSYSGKTDWAVNMGYSAEPIHEYTITFSRVGLYSFSELYAAYQPLDAITNNIEALKGDDSASISLDTNAFDIHIEDDAEESAGDIRYVFTSIPFSSGWSATLDGAPVEILKANAGFMAIAVDEGAHDIRFSYVTPGLLPGCVLSLAALLLLVGYHLISRWKANLSPQVPKALH